MRISNWIFLIWHYPIHNNTLLTKVSQQLSVDCNLWHTVIIVLDILCTMLEDMELFTS